MERKPAKLIIHVATNDAVDKSDDMIFFELLQLKAFIHDKFGITAALSCPTLRTDNSTAMKVISSLFTRLEKLNIPLIVHNNISEDCLGKGGKTPGLHLNPKGCGRMAINFLSYNRKH